MNEADSQKIVEYVKEAYARAQAGATAAGILSGSTPGIRPEFTVSSVYVAKDDEGQPDWMEITVEARQASLSGVIEKFNVVIYKPELDALRDTVLDWLGLRDE